MASRFRMPPEIAEVYVDFDWDRKRLWDLVIQPETIDRTLLDWHLDLPFWSSRPPEPLFDVIPRQVLDSSSSHAVHARRIREANLNYPIDVTEHRGRLCILDGMHRLAKAVREGRTSMIVRRVPQELAASLGELSRLPLVYLDQSVWSSWARGSYPAEVTDRLVALAHDLRFLLVVSRWHIVETVKQQGPDLAPKEAKFKLDQASFMDSFPNRAGLRETDDLLVQEVARAYATHFGKELAHDPPPFIAAGEFKPAVHAALEKQAGYVPRGYREFRALAASGGRGSMGWWSFLDQQVNRVYQASYRAADMGRAQAKRPRTWVTGLRERLTIKPVVRFLEKLDEAVSDRRFVAGLLGHRRRTAQYLGFEPGAMDFLRSLWGLNFRESPALAYRVAYERLLDPSGERRPHVNDGRDVEHGFAAPFVDILVHESAHFEIARKAAKQAGLACKVFNGRPKAKQLGAVVAEIESWK
jgi:hypothetical protein